MKCPDAGNKQAAKCYSGWRGGLSGRAEVGSLGRGDALKEESEVGEGKEGRERGERREEKRKWRQITLMNIFVTWTSLNHCPSRIQFPGLKLVQWDFYISRCFCVQLNLTITTMQRKRDQTHGERWGIKASWVEENKCSWKHPNENELLNRAQSTRDGPEKAVQESSVTMSAVALIHVIEAGNTTAADARIFQLFNRENLLQLKLNI